MIEILVPLIVLTLLLFVSYVAVLFYRKNVHIWLWSYLIRPKVSAPSDKPIHILFAFCDHFEPRWGNASPEEEDARVEKWCKEYPKLAAGHSDADGNAPKHSFFYPEEEYSPRHLDKLAKLCAAGYGEIEIHMHHDNDTPEGFSNSINNFLTKLDKNHGVVSRDNYNNRYLFSFIHGDWALDNSYRDGRCCGVSNELAVLRELGCYADFTLPSAPSETQTQKINSIYYATGVKGKSKSHNDGIDIEVGKQGEGDVLIIQGPLGFNWKNRKYGLLPRIENSDIRKNSPPVPSRVDMWANTAIHVKGRPEWRFIKIHTHGSQEDDMETLLGEPTDKMFSYLEEAYNDGEKYILHYVSAREMYNIAKAAEAGKTGDPNKHRDYIVPRPPILADTGTTQSE